MGKEKRRASRTSSGKTKAARILKERKRQERLAERQKRLINKGELVEVLKSDGTIKIIHKSKLYTPLEMERRTRKGLALRLNLVKKDDKIQLDEYVPFRHNETEVPTRGIFGIEHYRNTEYAMSVLENKEELNKVIKTLPKEYLGQIKEVKEAVNG